VELVLSHEQIGKRISKTTGGGVFLANLDVFRKVVKHCFACLMLLNQKQNQGETGEIKSHKICAN